MTPLDIEAFNNAIAKLLSDPARLKRYGRRSAELSLKFSIQGQVETLENLYIEAILQNWRGKGARIFSRKIR